MALSLLSQKIKEQRENDTKENRLKLEYYLSMGYLDKAKNMIYSGVSVNDVTIIIPIYWGHLNIVKFLIENWNVSINRRALCVAVRHNKLEIVKYIISKGANVYINSEFPLMTAIYYGNLDIVIYLIEKIYKSKNGYDLEQSYLLAKNRGHSNIIEYLNKKRK